MRLDIEGDSIRVRSEGNLRSADISTEEYPGFPTDMQAQYMALATQAEGTSVVVENIFREPLYACAGTGRMGANIKVDGRTATIRGKDSSLFRSCHVFRPARLCFTGLAAMVAEGETILDRVYHIDRGYERIEEKLRSVGAEVRRLGNIFASKPAV